MASNINFANNRRLPDTKFLQGRAKVHFTSQVGLPRSRAVGTLARLGSSTVLQVLEGIPS